MTLSRVVQLDTEHSSLGLELLVQAFAHDPTLSWYLFGQRADFEFRRRAYLEAYLGFHLANHMPVLGAWKDDQLLGVIYFYPGNHRLEQTSLIALGQRIEHLCGAACLDRLDNLLAAFDQRLPQKDLARIEFIAVAPQHHGKGIGSALLATCLDWLRKSGSPGVALETGEPRNLPLYKRHGFQLHDTLQLSGLTQYYLQQPFLEATADS